MPHIWVSSAKVGLFNKEKITTLSLKTSDKENISVMSANVVGIIEGSDPILKN